MLGLGSGRERELADHSLPDASSRVQQGAQRADIQAFSPEVRDIFERFEFAAQIDRLSKSGLLYQVTEKFARADLHPDRVDNHQMALCSRS